MAKPIPFFRNTHAARARRAKAMLLPMPRATADELALQAHVALDALRRGQGSVPAAQTMTQAMILAGFLTEAGYGAATDEQMRDAEQAVSAAFDRGRETGEWVFDAETFALFATIVTAYDNQLQKAPLGAIADASDRLDRFCAGQPSQNANRKRA
jgi:hypothetical protein